MERSVHWKHHLVFNLYITALQVVGTSWASAKKINRTNHSQDHRSKTPTGVPQNRNNRARRYRQQLKEKSKQKRYKKYQHVRNILRYHSKKNLEMLSWLKTLFLVSIFTSQHSKWWALAGLVQEKSTALDTHRTAACRLPP